MLAVFHLLSITLTHCSRKHSFSRMPSSFSMPSRPAAILSDATNGIRNNVRRMRSRSLWDQPRAPGKENRPPGDIPYLHLATVPDVLVSNTISRPTTSLTSAGGKWDPVDGTIVIKVHVPVTDDIWRLRVPQDVSFSAFHQKVEAKIGFPVVLGLTELDTFTEVRFQQWVGRRVRNGRNTPLTARPAWMDVKTNVF